MGLNLSISVTDFEGKKSTPREAFNRKVSYEEMGKVVSLEHARIAKEVLREEIGKGFDKNYTRTVDRIVNRLEEQVKPFGRIEYEAKADGGLAVALLKTYKKILNVCPVSKGYYKDSNAVYYNGRRVASDEKSLAAWLITPQFGNIKVGDEIQFANLMPYARRLEFLGKSGTRTKRRYRKAKNARKGLTYAKMEGLTQFVNKPSGSYYLATRSAKRFIRGSGSVRFEFTPGSDLGLLFPFKIPLGRKGFRTKFKKDGRFYLYPTITIIVLEGKELLQ